MPRPMPENTWQDLEATVIHFCEVRAEYRRRQRAGNLGRELEQRFIQTLHELDARIESLRSGDELARARGGSARERAVDLKAWRIAQ